MRMRFVLFGTPASDDTIVNTDHVVSVDQIQDSTQDGQDMDVYRLFLTTPIWADEDGSGGITSIDVVGCLFDVHRMLNGVTKCD